MGLSLMGLSLTGLILITLTTLIALILICVLFIKLNYFQVWRIPYRRCFYFFIKNERLSLLIVHILGELNQLM